MKECHWCGNPFIFEQDKIPGIDKGPVIDCQYTFLVIIIIAIFIMVCHLFIFIEIRQKDLQVISVRDVYLRYIPATQSEIPHDIISQTAEFQAALLRQRAHGLEICRRAFQVHRAVVA